MSEKQAKEILDKIVAQVFGYQNPYSLEQFASKFSFDVRLPKKVADNTTGEDTWASSTNPTKYITRNNSIKEDLEWQRPKKPLNSMEELLASWNDINYTTTERQLDSENISKSDNINRSQNIYKSQDIHDSKNIVFCDGVVKSEYVAASQRSGKCVYSIRVEDSINISKSFGIAWSGQITNCFMLHDCFDMSDSMFCSHMKSKRFCVANMQFNEEEYKNIRDMVIKWILS